MNPIDDRKRRIADVWHRTWNDGRVDALDELLAPGYVRHTQSGDQDAASFKDSITMVKKAFPGLSTVIDDMVGENDKTVMRWHSVGTHQGEFLDVPPTEREVTVSGITIARFDGARIAEEWVTWDPRDLLTTLGILTLRDIT
ncbi:ester cyclase [Spirillospora sp. CA-128828]|uniref:ester cyclase n=1 Tax=Spirillospora sp. CA-128828 TaxID=3240033 RepID=UPI003D94C7B7